MLLKSFGCSFTFGTDMGDTFHDKGQGTYLKASHRTWPALLANKLDLGYVCYAKPGSGNFRIAERVLTHLATNERSMFVINWTWIDRFDYATEDDQWKTILPVETTPEAKFYYRHFHSSIKDKFTTLISAKIVLDELLSRGYPFIMTYMDHLMFEKQWNTTPAIVNLQQSLRPYMYDFQGKNFLDWSRSQGYAVSPTDHPLEEAHCSAADVIYDGLREDLRPKLTA